MTLSALVANGNEAKLVETNSKAEKKIAQCVKGIFKELAELLIEDAEGATKKIKISVSKANNLQQAKSVALQLPNLP